MTSEQRHAAEPWLRRLVQIEPAEIAAALSSFAMFFALLSAYYVIRPVRDEMGVAIGKDGLHQLFTITFLAMLALVPAFGFVATKFPRRIVLPSLYLFFVLNLVGFWLLLRSASTPSWVAPTFFVWASVFNLFVVSLFWSLMSELWSNAEAKRIYGFISAGGSAGALAGPIITQALVHIVTPIDLLLAAAVLLALSALASIYLRRIRSAVQTGAEEATGGGILDGAIKVFTTPLFARIALFIFLANVVGTFFYLEQSRLVAATIPDSASRVKFFSQRDLIVSTATILIELFGTARILARFGVTTALLALPTAAALGTVLLTFDQTLWAVAAVMVAERVVAFSLANPAVKVIYTLTAPDEKYKVQNFIDTAVYRGGDAASGWLDYYVIAGAGFATLATSAVAAPLILVWIYVAKLLGADHKARAAEQARQVEGS